MERRLAAILAADLVGYTRLMKANEAETFGRLAELRHEVLDPLIAEHRGRIVKLMGDGLLVEFPSVVDAVACATAWQDGVENHEAGIEPKQRLEYRIGINVGDVIVDGGDLLGDGVNIASRIEGQAPPGGICLSEDAYRQARGKVAVEFQDLGSHALKNVAEPVRIFGVSRSSAGTAFREPGAPLPLPDRPSVVVLPFTNMSGDPEQEYLVDGLVEDIITELSCFRSLFVIARNSAFLYKGRPVNVREVGRELGVRYVVEGSIRRTGKRIRTTAQLIEAESGSHLWADRFDSDLDDIFAVQDEISQAIVTQLVGRLERAERDRALRKTAGNLSAYDLLLKGKFILGRGSRKDILEARRLFEQALELDPNYAQAHVQLAETYIAEMKEDWTDSGESAAEHAFEHALKAVELDDCDSEAHLAMAWAYFRVKSNFELASQAIEKAMSLNPNNYWNYCFKSWYLSCAGDVDGGINCGNEAIRRNPFLPDGCLYSIGHADYQAGRYERALSTFRKITTRYTELSACIAACHAQLGRDDNARAAASEFRELAARRLPTDPLKDSESWRAFWLNFMPFREEAMLLHLLDGLRKAGLAP